VFWFIKEQFSIVNPAPVVTGLIGFGHPGTHVLVLGTVGRIESTGIRIVCVLPIETPTGAPVIAVNIHHIMTTST
jgi:hypothetical protein